MPDTPRTESRGRRTRVAEGVYKDRYGLAATVKVHGVQREIRFPPDTSLKDDPGAAGRAAGEPADTAARQTAHPGA